MARTKVGVLGPIHGRQLRKVLLKLIKKPRSIAVFSPINGDATLMA